MRAITRLAVAVVVAALIPACGGGGGGDGGGGGGGGGGGAAGDGATLTYSNGHPLNWSTTDATALSNEDQINTLVNDHRVSMGLNALVHDPTMRLCARGHSRHMRGDYHPFFAHTNPEGQAPWDRMTANGIVWTAAGENIAAGYATPTAAYNGWMGSSGHRANIESASWGRTGVGYQPGSGTNGDWSTYWTQIFAN